MISREVLKEVRRIQVTTSRLVTDVFAGHYHSVFKGRGMEFDEVRQYMPGDDIRSIDWNVTARTGEPFIKKFVEERELSFMLMLDISGSSDFGSSSKLKRRLAAELCSILALSAIRNNDKVGLIAFSDRTERYVPPGKGMSHVLRIIREALYHKPEGKGTDIKGALEHLGKVMKKNTVVFLLSDFIDKDYQRTLTILNRRHDIVAMSITDPREVELPDVGLLEIQDAETGQPMLIDTANRAMRTAYRAEALRRKDARTRAFAASGVDHIEIRTDEPYTKTLFRFFRMRERRIR